MIDFGTKAETLQKLENQLSSATVLPQVCISLQEWRNGRSNLRKRLERLSWCSSRLIVRSSAKNEDSQLASNAGKYISLANVKGESAIDAAIDTVFASYQDTDPENQVFIQPMLTGIVLSGVAFSIDPNNGGNYIVINYDESGKSTSSVTSGTGGSLKTYYYFKRAPFEAPEPMKSVILLIRELESKLGSDKLDIEFAIGTDERLYLLQVRPLVVSHEIADLQEQAGHLERIYKMVESAQGGKPYLFGNRTVLGVMPDWNPAEIIGIRPRPLALSLYKELVTDYIWAYQRDNYGYQNLRSFPLLINLMGFPYIDTRVSFNSFIPKGLDPIICEKLVHYYTSSLIENPQSHDKVEFDIVFSCYTFDLPERMARLHEHGFTATETDQLESCLIRLTKQMIDMENGLLRKDLEKIEELESRRESILNSSLDQVSKIYWLIEDCKRYGTLPFAGLARGGFVAVQMLRSLVATGVLGETDYHRYMASLETVSSKISQDFASLSQQAFCRKYGHLRPGTYEITSKRYDENLDLYFDFSSRREPADSQTLPFSLSLKQLQRIQELLDQHRLECNVLTFFDFLKLAIEGREYSKFVFTKSLSAALRIFDELAAEHGVTTEEASYADIRIIKQAYESEMDVGQLLTATVERGRERHAGTLQLTLPPIIACPSDVWAFHQTEFEPNFITMKHAVSNVTFLHEHPENLQGNILFIPHADPGYDWIFSKKIAGFITMYGGVNSHMAIRAGELSIPAVIGVGEQVYNRFSRAKTVEIDCAGKRLNIIR